MFRCAKDGLIADLFAQAGLKNILQSEIAGKLNCQTTDTYWSFVSEVVGPVVSALAQANNATHEKIKTELYNAVGPNLTRTNAWKSGTKFCATNTKLFLVRARLFFFLSVIWGW